MFSDKQGFAPSRIAIFATTSLLLILAGTCGCGDPGPPPGQPIAQLLAGGLCPLEVVSVSARISPMGSIYNVQVKNISDAPIIGFHATIVYHVEGGGTKRQEVDQMSSIEALGPGQTAEYGLVIPESGATQARVIIRDGIYEGERAGYKLNFKFKNQRYEAQLAEGAPAT